MRLIATIVAAAIVSGGLLVAARAQDVVKIGQIEAQTGPNAIYGWMGSQGGCPWRLTRSTRPAASRSETRPTSSNCRHSIAW